MWAGLVALSLASAGRAQTQLGYEQEGRIWPIAGLAGGAPATLREDKLVPIREGGEFRLEPAAAFAALDTDTVLRYQINRLVDATRQVNRERWIVTWQMEVRSRLDVAQLYAVRAWEKDGRFTRIAVKPLPPVLKGDKQVLADQFEIEEADGDGRLRVHVFRGTEEIRAFPATRGGGFDPQLLLTGATPTEAGTAASGAAEAAKKLRLTDVLSVVRAGSRDTLEALLALGTAVRGKDDQGRNALHAAAECGRAGLVPVLLRAGVDPNQRDSGAYSPLMRAAALGHDSVVAALVQGGATVGLEDRQGQTALTLAALTGRAELVRTLLAAGAKWPRTGARLAELLAGAVRSRYPDVVRLLLAAGADPNFKAGQVPLIVLAAATATWEEADALLKAGAKIEARDGAGATALIHGARRDRLDLVNLLLAAGADLNATDQRGSSALLEAFERNCRAVIPTLLERGASTAPVAKLGETALRHAILRADRPTISRLHAAGARLHRKETTAGVDDTLLAQAIAQGLDEVVAAALDHGWTLRAALFGSWSLAEVAERHGQKALWDRLVAAQPDPRATPARLPFVRGDSKADPLVPLLRVAPEYPPTLSATQSGGEAVVDFWVTPDGQAVLPRVTKADRPELALPAQRALLGWRFVPSKQKPPGWRHAQIPFAFAEPQLAQARIFNQGQVDQQASPVRQAKPELPPDYPAGKIAAVWVSIVVDEAGKVCGEKVRAATDDALRACVLAAVREWEFRPARIGDRPVWVRYEMFFMFPSGEDLPADGVTPALLPVGAKTTLPRIVEQPAPLYPKERLSARRTYLAIGEFTISERGGTVDARVVAGSDEVFNRAAVDALKRWKFKAPVIDGRAATLQMRVPVLFVPPSETALTF